MTPAIPERYTPDMCTAPSVRRASTFLALVIAVPLAIPASSLAAAHAPALCRTLATKKAKSPRVAILSAFPAEMAAMVAAIDLEQTVTVDGRSYDLGVLGGVRVVLGLLGIGLENATTRSTSVLDNFDVAAVIVSGVAGTGTQRIGDVIVPEAWTLKAGGGPYPVNPALYALAGLAASTPTLENCPRIPPDQPSATCLPYVPAVVLGGIGETDDPFNGTALPCTPGGNDLGGCELPAPALAVTRATDDTVRAVDEETAGVARAASEHGVPFLAFRAASDELDFGQFALYYRLAARNEGAATIAFLQRLASLHGSKPAARRVCAHLAHRRWQRAADILNAHPSLTAPAG